MFYYVLCVKTKTNLLFLLPKIIETMVFNASLFSRLSNFHPCLMLLTITVALSLSYKFNISEWINITLILMWCKIISRYKIFGNKNFFKPFAIQVVPVVLCKVCGPLMCGALLLIETNGYQTQSEDDDNTDIYLSTNLYDPGTSWL